MLKNIKEQKKQNWTSNFEIMKWDELKRVKIVLFIPRTTKFGPQEGFRVEVHASRDIPPGEEVTTRYKHKNYANFHKFEFAL